MINEMPIEILRKIIISQVELGDDRVMIYNGKYKIPADDKLFVYLEYKNGRIISNRINEFIDDGIFKSNQDLNVKESIAVGIFSRNLDALTAKEAIVMSLFSQYSQKIQEANSFKIFPYAPIDNLSELEGDAQLYRFEISVILFSWYKNITPVDYFNIYRVAITQANAGGDEMQAEFTQPLTLPIL